MDNGDKNPTTKHAYVVVDAKGRGYSKRHGTKDIPSVYEHERNAETFIKKHPGKKLRILPCAITF